MNSTSGGHPHELRSTSLNGDSASPVARSSGDDSDSIENDAAVYAAQEEIYSFLLKIVRQWPPEEVLLEVKQLFFYQVELTGTRTEYLVYQIVSSNNETVFRNTLKRCCYILVNNWDAARHYKPIQELIRSFQNFTIEDQTASPLLKRLKSWIKSFINSKDYEELELFTARYEDQQKRTWVRRYTSYLLVPQYVNPSNSLEQREAARALSRQLKDRFKFDLAMYIARSQSASSPEKLPKNPTELGDNVVQMIKSIVAKRGQFSYTNLANIFINQIQTLTYQEFKQSLQKYLIFSVQYNSELVVTLQAKLSEKLKNLYTEYDNNPISDALILRTCNRVIDLLTTEDRKEPSSLFVLLLSQGNPMTLVIVLLKLVLVCSASRSHLEARIAQVIQHYEDYAEEECSWVVNFLEIFNVTFAIHAENVQYNLVKMQEAQSPQAQLNLDHYRIFSQMKPIIRAKSSRD